MAASEPDRLSPTDESRYRKEVLHLPGEDSTEEEILEEQLIVEASQLGLKIPEIQIAASLAATINAGFLDVSAGLTRPSLSHPHSFSDLVGRSSVVSIDPLSSEATLSDRGGGDGRHSDSIPSIGSFSTRPTSISSCDVRIVPPLKVPAQYERKSSLQPHHVSSLSPSSPTSLSVPRQPERKRSSFISAIGRPFRKLRIPSAVNLPPNAHISVKKNEGDTGAILVETKPEAEQSEENVQAQEAVTFQVEVSVFDEAALQRSMDDEQLKVLFERHKAERTRFVRLQNELLDSLKAAHLVVVAERKASNEEVEKEKQEKNEAYISRMEERQLAVEMDQMKEFEKAKQNSQTRIKYMEGYLGASSPPQSPSLSTRESFVESVTQDQSQQQQLQLQQQQRLVTRRQKEQLAQEYLDRDSMDRLHEARIKVLRERQEQQLQETITRLDRQLDTLINKNTENIAELERGQQRAEQEMLKVFETKKNRLRRRWNIEEAVLRRRLEDQNQVPYGPLPSISFSDEDGHGHQEQGEKPVLRNPFA